MRKGEVVNADSFDSNCITPGTPFMARLGAHLRYFVRKKIAEDPAWQRPHIIFSGKLKRTYARIHTCNPLYACTCANGRCLGALHGVSSGLFGHKA